MVATHHNLLLLLGFSFAFGRIELNTEPSEFITTPLGDIEGSLLESRLGKTIYAFRGIRYAKPPVDELRFEPPQPVEKWEGVYNGLYDGELCPQPTFLGPTSEDCLFLNVFTTKLPKNNTNPKRSVLVYFHPGGFYAASGVSYYVGPEYLMDQEIVFVAANYRLGVLGYLSTGTKEAPGNNGFKDQVLVLQWVKDNILSFGGDPNSVTISGYSAGSHSVAAHLVSPMSKGLFHRAIMMSGSSYIRNIPTDQLNLVQTQARLVNCPDQNVTEMISCLKAKPVQDFENNFDGFREFGFEPVGLWNIVIEPDFGQPRFLTEAPVQSVLKGNFQKVPIIVGTTANEFAGRAFYILENETLVRELDENFDTVAPIAFLYERNTSNSRRISKELRHFYFGGKKIDNTSVDGLTKLFADSIVGFNMNRAAKILSEKNNQPVFYYCFNYTGRYSYFYLPGTNMVPFGPAHHDDLIYLVRSINFPYFNQTDPEYEVMRKLTTMWGNFVKTGKPIPVPTKNLGNVTWKPFSKKHQVYMRIGRNLTIGEKLYEERYAVWEKLFPLPAV